jgi:hypothetical protein
LKSWSYLIHEISVIMKCITCQQNKIYIQIQKYFKNWFLLYTCLNFCIKEIIFLYWLEETLLLSSLDSAQVLPYFILSTLPYHFLTHASLSCGKIMKNLLITSDQKSCTRFQNLEVRNCKLSDNGGHII